MGTKRATKFLKKLDGVSGCFSLCFLAPALVFFAGSLALLVIGDCPRGCGVEGRKEGMKVVLFVLSLDPLKHEVRDQKLVRSSKEKRKARGGRGGRSATTWEPRIKDQGSRGWKRGEVWIKNEKERKE